MLSTRHSASAKHVNVDMIFSNFCAGQIERIGRGVVREGPQFY